MKAKEGGKILNQNYDYIKEEKKENCCFGLFWGERRALIRKSQMKANSCWLNGFEAN